MKLIREYIEYYLLENNSSIKSLLKTYKDAKIKVSKNYPGLSGQYWIGMWHYDKNFNVIISLEKMYVDAILKKNTKKAQQILLNTLKHEYEEAKITLEIAKKTLKEKGVHSSQALQYMKDNFTGPEPISFF